MTVPKINTREEAKDVFRQVAEEFNVTMEELLDPNNIAKFYKKSAVLRAALDYFRDEPEEKKP